MYVPKCPLAGERGPELVVGARGSKVYTADETKNIFSSMARNDRPISISPDALSSENSSEKGETHFTSNKKITLEIQGSGAIDIPKGASKESILKVMTENMKPILMGIIQQGVLEEGKMAYEW